MHQTPLCVLMGHKLPPRHILLELYRVHVQVLHEAGVGGAVEAAAVGQEMKSDDEIPGFGSNGYGVRIQVHAVRVGTGREA